MKRQRLKFKLLAVLLFAMIALMAAYGAYSVISYGNRWFSSSRNPRVREQKRTVFLTSTIASAKRKTVALSVFIIQ